MSRPPQGSSKPTGGGRGASSRSRRSGADPATPSSSPAAATTPTASAAVTVPPASAAAPASWLDFLRGKEIELAAIVLTIIITIVQTNLTARQTEILEAQTRIAADQAGTARLQNFLSAAQASGIASPEQRRMAMVAISLLDQLVHDDPKNQSLRSALPRITGREFEMAMDQANTEEEREDVRRLYSRLKSATTGVKSVGNYYIILAAVRTPAYAERNYIRALELAESSPGHLGARLFYNPNNAYYAVALGAFESEGKALAAIPRKDPKPFRGLYVSQSAGWEEVCSDGAKACSEALARRPVLSIGRDARSQRH